MYVDMKDKEGGAVEYLAGPLHLHKADNSSHCGGNKIMTV